MKVKSHFKEYTVEMRQDFTFIPALLHQENTIAVVDSNVYRIYKAIFDTVQTENLIVLEATEANKTIETALSICERFTELSAKRNAKMVSFGGGIVQDITGFAANMLYRGIDWIFVPTTLLAACDSCIGGKTSLNYKSYKNLLGTFYPPNTIYICPQFFQSLPEADYKSGLGEVLKFNIMQGDEGMARMEAVLPQLLARDNTQLELCVNSSLEYKKHFIEADEFDRGERIKLNFAHTFGHAIETVTRYKIPHGTAVAIGMVMANHVSCCRGLLSQRTVERAERILFAVISMDIDFSACSLNDFVAAMRKDKKQIGENLTVVLASQDFKELKIVHDCTVSETQSAVEYFENKYAELNH